MEENQSINRLRWQCRRGMLELDVFLQRFLESAYEELSESEQACFARLLEEQDQDLFEWLTGRWIPEDPELAAMVKKIRETHA